LTTESAIAVVDVGATNTRVILMDNKLREIDARKQKTVHRDGPPYKFIDDRVLLAFIADALVDLDRIRPVDTISVSAFGATAACVDAEGSLVLPVMDYLAEPPEAVVAGYAKIAPPFSEVFANTSPSALTLARQLYWIETEFSDAFARIAQVIPWSAYVGYRLGGVPAMEISNLGVFSHLIEPRSGAYSSLVVAREWSRLFPERRNAWDVIGAFRGPNGEKLRGKGEILCGIHDSNANWLRYLTSQSGAFTLLSTGTFLIGFDSSADLGGLTPENDTFSFNDIFGRPIACGRFYGGFEFNKITEGADPGAASPAAVQALIDQGVFALPSFSDTGGPIPRRGNRGKIIGGTLEDDETRVSLACLYYALMANEVLDALRSTGKIIIDGPVAGNPVLMSLIAQLRHPQPVVISAVSEGTALGAGVLGLMKRQGALPRFDTRLSAVAAAEFKGLSGYKSAWRSQIGEKEDA
jgi:L-fuculokinase